jgi:TRAP-type mannitol/chloroaromatic compound transport system permease large subunit
MLLAMIKGQLDWQNLRAAAQSTTLVTSMVFMILIGAAIFSLVFRGFGGEQRVAEFFQQMPGGLFGATLLVMVVIFVLGFILDFIEITFVVVPIVAPILLAMGLDPIWLGVMIAINLQTSFLTPPFGFALFLPARCGARQRAHRRHVPRRAAVYWPASGPDVDVGSISSNRNLAAFGSLPLTMITATPFLQ